MNKYRIITVFVILITSYSLYSSATWPHFSIVEIQKQKEPVSPQSYTKKWKDLIEQLSRPPLEDDQKLMNPFLGQMVHAIRTSKPVENIPPSPLQSYKLVGTVLERTATLQSPLNGKILIMKKGDTQMDARLDEVQNGTALFYDLKTRSTFELKK